MIPIRVGVKIRVRVRVRDRRRVEHIEIDSSNLVEKT
jgi:hypothetical protein